MNNVINLLERARNLLRVEKLDKRHESHVRRMRSYCDQLTKLKKGA